MAAEGNAIFIRESEHFVLFLFLLLTAIISRCGGAVGLYFAVKRCSLLYLYASNGTFTQSPYLDVHGEVDVSMRYVFRFHEITRADRGRRRGRRQYLHSARWEEIRKMWLNHGIPTAVARKLESAVDSGGWETL